MSPPRTIEISLLGRTFKVPCSKEEEPQLIAAVEYLDGKMRAIRENSKVIVAPLTVCGTRCSEVVNDVAKKIVSSRPR